MAEWRAEQFVDAARAATDLDDFGEDTWQEGLDRLLAALAHEAALNDLGRTIVEGEIIGYLSTRLQVMAEHCAHPENARADVVPPIVIIGQGRTGTTILHDLLAQDPATRVPLTWEVDKPCPPPDALTYDTDARIVESESASSMVDLVIPNFRAMHPMGALLPQECVRITALDFRSMIFPTQFRVPSYAKWLLFEADMAPAYRWHRLFLQHLQSRHPTDRWVVKSPGHIWSLNALMGEYSESLLVQTHRDPLRIIASLGSLVSTLRSLATDDTSIPTVAAEFAEYVIEGLDRSVKAREDGTVPADCVIDVQFAEFMADPFVTIRGIYDRLGMVLTDATERRMRAFLAANPQDKHGKHSYTFAATELDEREWRDRAHRYRDYFDVPSERLP
ncbi:MAG: sulfotransferase family protein [Actinomycetota bacterium]